MSTQHTPGPWHRNIKPASKYTVIFAGRNTHIARLVPDGLTDDEIEANCNLIAAAPELLEALETMRIAFDVCTGDMPVAKKKKNEARIKCRAAIAKVKGE